MAKRKKTGPPKKKACDKYRSITVTMPPEMYRDAKRSGSVSGYIRDLWSAQRSRR